MKTKKLVRALAACVCLAATSASQAAAVFKVSKGDDHIFVGGTFHILTAEDFPLANAFEKAYEQSDELVFETDIAAFITPAIQQQMMGVMMQPAGQTLTSQLSEQTAKDFTQFLMDRQLPVGQFDALSATGAMLTVTIMEYQAKGFTSQGVDAFYNQKAVADKKAITWLETVQSQIALLDSFDNDDPNALIKYTLEELEKSDEVIDNLHNAWKAGDLAALEQSGIIEMKRDYPQVYEDLILVRNNKWLPQIENMFSDDNVEYVLVGALHLAGEDSVLSMLEKKGYTVEKL